MIAPMRAELANSGYTETKTADEVKSAINADGTTFVVVNSVCGCAAGSARPAAMAVSKSAVKPTRMITVFAGNDVEAVPKRVGFFNFGNFLGRTAAVLALRAAQMLCHGQRAHRGDFGVQIVAPKSITACA